MPSVAKRSMLGVRASLLLKHEKSAHPMSSMKAFSDSSLFLRMERHRIRVCGMGFGRLARLTDEQHFLYFGLTAPSCDHEVDAIPSRFGLPDEVMFTPGIETIRKGFS